MSVPLYREVFKDAWQMFSRHKKLMWFGLLASALGTASVFEVLVKAYYRLKLEILPEAGFAYAWAAGIGAATTNPARLVPMVIGIFIMGFIVVVFALYFLVSAQGALVLAAARFEKHKDVHYMDAWNDARAKFWPLLAVNLLKGLLIIDGFLLLDPLARVSFYGGFGAWSALGLLVSIVILLALIILISYIALYAIMYIMVHEMPLGEAITSAWKLFFDHWLASFEVGFLIFLLEVGATALIFAAFVVLSMPVAVAGLFGYIFAVQGMFALVATVLIAVFLAVTLVIWSSYTAYAVSVWTSLFLHMDKGNMKSKILHWVGK